MHDPQALLADPLVEKRLARRRYVLDLPSLDRVVRTRSDAIATRDSLRGELKAATRAIQQALGDERAHGVERARDLRARIREAEAEQSAADERLAELLLTVPNVPLDGVPDGGPEDPAVEVRHWGEPPAFDFAPRDHVALGAATGTLDLERAVKLSGARFAVTSGTGARLERALGSFFLDLHTVHGYTEYGLPELVNRATMTATGQLPKFADDLFATEIADRELFLIPTAEVPLVNLFRGEVLAAEELPLALTAQTACYRAEAGSYGRDTRGIIRLHQFAKVELVRLCLADHARAEFELLVSHAEECLRRLGLHYRVVELRASDLGFAARRTYDIEVWLPGQSVYREISSVSDCGDFQARRGGIRARRAGTTAKEYVATLNGSGLPIGRTMVALYEQCQRRDGSIAIPSALVPYTGFRTIEPDGAAGR